MVMIKNVAVLKPIVINSKNNKIDKRFLNKKIGDIVIDQNNKNTIVNLIVTKNWWNISTVEDLNNMFIKLCKMLYENKINHITVSLKSFGLSNLYNLTIRSAILETCKKYSISCIIIE